MAEKTAHDLPIADNPANNDTKSDYGVESAMPTTSSSHTLAAIKMADNKIPEISDYWKKLYVSEKNRQAYHDFGWLTGNLISSIPEVDVPTTHDSIVVYFESHLVAGLGLPPNKFLVAIMNCLECELVHFNPNVIATLSCFTMLCAC
jgi:hypothetical protein